MNTNNKVTLVTGLWDLGRDKLNEGWSRSYEHYLEKFKEILKVKENLIVFGDEKLKEFVLQHTCKKKLLKVKLGRTKPYY